MFFISKTLALFPVWATENWTWNWRQWLINAHGHSTVKVGKPKIKAVMETGMKRRVPNFSVYSKFFGSYYLELKTLRMIVRLEG